MDNSTNVYLEPFRKYAVFSGRSSRAEYWTFWLANFFIGTMLGLMDPEHGTLLALFILATIVPALAVGVRRLHDTNRSGVWMLLGFIPLAAIILIIFLGEDSQAGENRFGENPKGA